MAITTPRIRSGRRWELEDVITFIAYIVLTIWAVLALFPLYWMFKLSFEPPQVVDMWPPRVLPWWGELSLDNFIALSKRMPIFRWLLNSGIVTIIRTTTAVFCGTLAGYTFAKLRFLGREVLFWILVSVIMIPGFVLIIPQYQIIKAFKWYDTYWALIVPGFSGGISAMFLMRQFMRTLPTELIESARMDGASEFTVFLRVMLPLAKPGLAVLAIFWFIGNWNAFIWPLVVTSDKLMRTLPVGLALLTSPRDTGQVAAVGQQMAGASIAAIPVIIVFLFFQRYFLKGITIGAIKG